MGRVIWSPQADDDLDEITAFIGRDSPRSAERLVDQFDAVARMLAERPLIGRGRDELLPGLRGYPVRDYIVFYRVVVQGIEVIRVLHGARNLRQLLRP